MSEPKVNLTIVLPGRTMMSEQSCSENDYDNFKIQISAQTKDKKTKQVTKFKDTISVNTRKCIPVKQSIKISDEAYHHMISNTGMPIVAGRPFPRGQWLQLNAAARLEVHFKLIAESLGGEVYGYEILDD